PDILPRAVTLQRQGGQAGWSFLGLCVCVDLRVPICQCGWRGHLAECGETSRPLLRHNPQPTPGPCPGERRGSPCGKPGSPGPVLAGPGLPAYQRAPAPFTEHWRVTSAEARPRPFVPLLPCRPGSPLPDWEKEARPSASGRRRARSQCRAWGGA
ncbi:hypothetical protein H696_06078, partial [Fonticula alba]